MTARRTQAILALLLATCLVLAPARAADKELPTQSVVPFQMLLTNHMVVRAQINGKGPYRLVFDLGAPITLLSNKAAEDAGVIDDDAPRSFLFSMRGASEVRTLEIGDLKAEKVSVMVFDHPVLKALGDILGRPLDGIIGHTFFSRYKTTIDYQARQMTFEPVEHPARDLMQDLQARLSGPRVARHRVLAPGGLWGLTVGAPQQGLDSLGVPVLSVAADSPAAAAGLRPGDVLTTLDGRWTTSIPDVYAAAASIAAGQPAAVVVVRDGRELAVTVTPREGF